LNRPQVTKNLNTIFRRQQHPPLQWSRVIEYTQQLKKVETTSWQQCTKLLLS